MSTEKEYIIISDTLRGVGTEELAGYLCHAYCHEGSCEFTYNNNVYMLSAGECLIVRRGDLVSDIRESTEFRVDVIYVTPEFIEISTPQSNYGMKGSLALFNNPIMHLTEAQQKVCALDFDYIKRRWALADTHHFHRDAMHYFRQYMIVGGMPQAVAEYAQTKDFNKVDAIKRQILRLYKNDIKKYAGSATARVEAIYDAIPGQLQKHEKKFTLAALKDEARMREYDSAFFWLDDARIANICYNTTAPSIGLQLNEDRTALKCYFCDTGLLISLAFNARGIVSNEIYQKLMFDKLEINEGMLVENIVAQMLKATNKKLYFYNNYDKEEAENRMEVDFLIQKETVTSRHNISPIEVKSSTNYTLTSIKKCIEKYRNYLSTPYVLHSKDIETKDGLVFLPLYMTPLL